LKKSYTPLPVKQFPILEKEEEDESPSPTSKEALRK